MTSVMPMWRLTRPEIELRSRSGGVPPSFHDAVGRPFYHAAVTDQRHGFGRREVRPISTES